MEGIFTIYNYKTINIIMEKHDIAKKNLQNNLIPNKYFIFI